MSCFEDFKRDDGSPITVEYEVSGSYVPTSYSPLTGADGGDAPEFTIIDAWPNTTAYEALSTRKLDCETLLGRTTAWGGKRDTRWRVRLWAWCVLQVVRSRMWWQRVDLTLRERERMEAWLAENHQFDDDDSDYWDVEPRA